MASAAVESRSSKFFNSDERQVEVDGLTLQDFGVAQPEILFAPGGSRGTFYLDRDIFLRLVTAKNLLDSSVPVITLEDMLKHCPLQELAKHAGLSDDGRAITGFRTRADLTRLGLGGLAEQLLKGKTGIDFSPAETRVLGALGPTKIAERVNVYLLAQAEKATPLPERKFPVSNLRALMNLGLTPEQVGGSKSPFMVPESMLYEALKAKERLPNPTLPFVQPRDILEAALTNTAPMTILPDEFVELGLGRVESILPSASFNQAGGISMSAFEYRLLRNLGSAEVATRVETCLKGDCSAAPVSSMPFYEGGRGGSSGHSSLPREP